MTTERLQLALIPDASQGAQSLAMPPEARSESVELVALMLVRLVRDQRLTVERREVRDESR